MAQKQRNVNHPGNNNRFAHNTLSIHELPMDQILSYTLSGDPTHQPVILFLHGFMGCKEDWEEIINLLRPDFCCLAIDLPGHGSTEVAPGEYQMPACAGLICDLLVELKINACYLAGYSMGGRLGLYLAIHHGSRIKKAIIESASPGLQTEEERLVRRQADDLLAQRLLKEDFEEFLKTWYDQPLFQSISKEGKRFERMIEWRLRNNPKKLAASLRAMGTGCQPSLWADLTNLQKPILHVVGEHDLKYQNIARQIVARCSQAQISLVPDSGHNCHFERPETYAQILKAFIFD